MRKLALLMLLALPVGAQTVLVSGWPNGWQTLNSGWRTHAGDNAAWAQPSFDDSAWPSISLTVPNDHAGWRWYRLRVQFPARNSPLALLVTGGGGTYEVYVNGKRLPGPGLLPDRFVTWPRTQVIPLQAVAGNVVIAFRTRIPTTSMFLADRGSIRVDLGTLPAIRTAHQAEIGTQFERLAPGLAIYLLILFAGFPLLALFWYQPDHREYLWLGCYLLVDAIGALSYDFATSGFVPFSLNWAISTPANYLIAFFQIQFTFSFVGQRVTRGWRLYQGFLFAYPVLLGIPAWLGYLTRSTFDVGEIVVIVPTALVLPLLLLYWYRRGNREAGWLILPSLLPLVTISVADIGIVGGYLGLPRLALLSNRLPIGPFSLQSFEIADLLFLLSIGFVMFFRFTRVSAEQAHAAAEFEAAQRVQALLLRSAQSPGGPVHVDAVYHPAQEVGGDFFHIAQIADATRIVIGDVSGKGLGAAMLVSVLVGALDTRTDASPAAVIHRLNRIMLTRQQGGFATCICALIAPDGTLTLANAGHLAPYRNGEEVPLPPALPLGLSADTEYPETSLQLAPSDTLTFLSDGVVEAQDAQGQLFGFDRTRAISTQSAEAIAQAAQHHGQQDDITVLTLQFAPAEVLHA